MVKANNGTKILRAMDNLTDTRQPADIFLATWYKSVGEIETTVSKNVVHKQE